MALRMARLARPLLSMVLLCGTTLTAQQSAVPTDSDKDGLDDQTEQALMERFLPTFMMDAHDCSIVPAHFAAGTATPLADADNATLYAQAFPDATRRSIEVHYYHLWRRDCGKLSHALDAEHVSVLLQTESAHPTLEDWHATYWYAAAHEDTLCDASQITRASTLHATDHGATIWISAGKHASFLHEELCQRGCGGDRCKEMVKMQPTAIINLGEPQAAMHQTLWASSTAWPLRTKMSRSDMPEARLARLQTLPDTDIAWANPSKRPAQATIAAGTSTADALADSDRRTNTALALSTDQTTNALGVSYQKTKHALSTSIQGVGHFLGKKDAPATTDAH